MPPKLRTDLRYPHLKDHARHQFDRGRAFRTDRRDPEKYFDVVEARALGRAGAYQLLWNNKELFHVRDTPDGCDWIDKVIEADIRYTDGKVENSLFAFLLCRPKKGALDDKHQLIEWTREELQREQRMQAYGDRYYPKEALEIIYE